MEIFFYLFIFFSSYDNTVESRYSFTIQMYNTNIHLLCINTNTQSYVQS